MAPSTSRHARDSDAYDGDEQPSQRSQSSGGARPRGRKRGFLENSKLTDQDRRHVRWKERELLQDMKENASELAKLTSDRFNDTTHKLDEIYEDVCYPREANLDASNLDELNQAVAKQSQSLGASDLTKYDVSDLVKSTREACCPESGGVFDWETLGSAAGACFRSVPDVSFLFGLMDTQVVHKERKRARRAREDDDVQASQPSEYTSKKDRKDAQAARLEVLQRKMESVRKKRMFDVVINPKSFTQTVENMFDTSFLVRNGAIEIGVDDRGVPYLENREGLQIEEAVPAQTQSIISITPAQWQEIASVWGHDEPLVGHRS